MARQVQVLVANALRLDLRPRAAHGEGRWARIAPLALQIFFHCATGLVVAHVAQEAGVPLGVAAVVCYVVSGTLVFMHLVAESDHLTAPLDGDILYWRPIPPHALFAARALHLLVWVLGLVVVQLAAPAALLASGTARPLATAATFLAGGLLHALWVASGAILLHGLVLRRLPAEKLHAVLTFFQLGFAVAFMAGSQLLAPQLWAAAGARAALDERWFLPPVWYAAWPSLVDGGWTSALAWRAGAGVAALAALVSLASARIAPRYEADVAALRLAEGRAAPPSAAGRWLDAAGTRLGGTPLREAGYAFLLAHLRGDRRSREALWTLLGVPLGLLLAALLSGGGADPYATPAAAAVDWGAANGPRLLFTSAYLVAWSMLGLGRALGRSIHWRGSWVFHAAPVRRYDEYCLGIGLAVVLSTLVPVFAVQAVALLARWGDPLHVAMHLAPPAGLALVALAAAPLVGFDPPFTREPSRAQRGADLALLFAAMLPIGAFAYLHWTLRDRAWLPFAAGAALAAAAPAVWSISRRRVRNCFRDRAFAA